MNRRSAIKTITSLAAAQALDFPSLLRAQTALDEPVPLPPSSRLPDALTFRDGKHVRDAQEWERRRAEILATAELQMYGVVPDTPNLRFNVFEKDAQAFNGLARRTQVKLLFKGSVDGPSADLLLYTPRHAHRAPVILGLNFWGNHTVCDDPGIALSTSWVETGLNGFVNLSCVVDHRATPGCRGIDARRWPIEEMLKRGYAFATMYRGDIDPDVADGSVPGVRAAYPELAERGDNFSAIAAWAWALSRSMDYLETNHRANRGIDAHRVAIFGWSRLGKAAVWAGARDRRFAAVLSNESGAGGAKLFRRGVGEDIHRLITLFPHWYCRNFRNYNGMDRELPFDQHLILASIAPRPLYVGSAAEDHLSDPEGEFASAVLASAVYRFLGSSGLDSTTMPAVGEAVTGRVSYHIRPGKHDVTDYDWQKYLAFLDTYLRTS
jgi:hypothetical protein